jgi:Cd2+/Zn2+-exporting ATPase
MSETVTQRSVFYVEGMCCADEQAVIEKKLRSLTGIEEYKFNLVARKLHVTHSLSPGTVITALHQIGFAAKVFSLQPDLPQPFFKRHTTAIVTMIAAVAAISGICLSAFGVEKILLIPFYATAIAVGGWKIGIKGWKAAFTFSLDMNVLMSVAVLGAIAIGKWEEGAAVIVLFAIAGLLEEMSVRRTRKAISSLMEMAPAKATVRRNFAEATIPVEEVMAGDIVIIRPGEKISVDGIVAKGKSFVNQSAITGESLSIEKTVGVVVYAGTINERGSLEIKATSVGKDTTLAHIVHLVEEAQAQRSPSQEFVDRFAKIYTPVVLAIAVLVVLIPPLLFAQAFGLWFYRGLVLLVIACPCALVISTPVTIISGLTAAARQGILIKGGRYLEEASKLRAILFDKTGTLTYGQPSVTDIVPLNSVPRREILRIAALGELKSEHSIARAIITKAEEEKLDLTANVDHFDSVAGRGIVIQIDNRQYTIGNHQFVEERGLCSAVVESKLTVLEKEGKTTTIVCSTDEVLGIIGVADSVRSESRAVIQHLRQSGVKEIVMISGDGSGAVRSAASNLGIDTYFGELLPADKVALVNRMKSKHGSIAMVGDGVNDAPALAASSLGIAMGISGTDVALETADVVLMKDDLSKIFSLISIGKRTMAVLRQNIALALIMKCAFLLLGIFGVATLWMAVIADDGVTLLVVLNSLRLLRKS